MSVRCPDPIKEKYNQKMIKEKMADAYLTYTNWDLKVNIVFLFSSYMHSDFGPMCSQNNSKDKDSNCT